MRAVLMCLEKVTGYPVLSTAINCKKKPKIKKNKRYAQKSETAPQKYGRM